MKLDFFKSKKSLEKSNIEIISVHVPKTAGSTFKNILTSIYGEESIYLDYSDRPGDPQSLFHTDYQAWRKNIPFFIKQIKREAKVIHGHFPAIKYKGYFHKAKRIIWLREPINRLISHFFYWKYGPASENSLHKLMLDKNMDLVEFARLPTMQNRITNIFMKDMELSDFYFIGIQEFFEEDIRQLGEMMGWKDLKIESVNINQHPEYKNFINNIDKKTYEYLISLNKKDMLLYESALELRNKRKI